MIRNMLAAWMGLVVLSGASAALATVPGRPGPGGPEGPGGPGGPGGFERWDRNHDGVIDREEFQQGVKRLRVAARKGPARAKGGPRGKPGPGGHERPGPGKKRGPGGPAFGGPGGPDRQALEKHVRRLVRRTVAQILREHQGRLREMVREAVGRALRDRPRPPEGPPPGARFFGGRHPGFEAGPPLAGPPLAGPRHRPGPRGRRGGPGMDHGPAMRGPRPFAGPDVGPDLPPPGKARGGADGRRGPGRRPKRAAGPKAGHGPPPKAGRIFRQHDANGDGFLTPDEFPGGPERFKRVDKNADGRIDRKELRKALRRGKGPRGGKGDAHGPRVRRRSRGGL